jgi:tetratricopeptide (TPR) repeat protein
VALDQSVVARDEADQAAVEAKEEAATTQEVLDFMVGLFEISDPSEARGETITAREILDRGVDQIDEGLEGEPLIKAKLQTVMGDVYRELGLYPAAEALLEEALAIRQRHLGFDDILTVEARGNLEGSNAAEIGDQFAEENIPLQRLQSADDIANTAVFLASDEASEITGDAINVGGGVVVPLDFKSSNIFNSHVIQRTLVRNVDHRNLALDRQG